MVGEIAEYVRHRHEPSDDIAETLWRRYRAIADAQLGSEACVYGRVVDPAVRGAVYVFIVDLIAVHIDRIENEPEPSRRKAMIDTLLAAGGPATAARSGDAGHAA